MKPCLNCGLEFDGSAQARFHSEACRKAFARRKFERLSEVEPGQLVHPTESEPGHELGQNDELGQGEPGQGTPPGELGQEPTSLESLIAHGRAGGVLTDEEEQRIRDHFGYTRSEARTLAERDRTARKITSSSLTEDEYVKSMLSHPELLNRARAERYARWRYREFIAGEVSSL